MAALNAVNVIEYLNGTIMNVSSFTDDAEGNKEAEELFIRIATENGMEEQHKEMCLEDGLFETGDFQVFLTHSMQYEKDEPSLSARTGAT